MDIQEKKNKAVVNGTYNFDPLNYCPAGISFKLGDTFDVNMQVLSEASRDVIYDIQ
jgi:hypothetical protein